MDSLNVQVLDHNTQITSLNGRMNNLENHFDLLSAHLFGFTPGAILVAVEFPDEDLRGADLRERIWLLPI